MNMPAVDRKPTAWTARASMWAGILGLLPYVGILIWPLLYDLIVGATVTPHPYTRAVLRWLFNLMAIAGSYIGLPFGLAGIILGVTGLKVSQGIRENRIACIAGILLGIGGIAGELWLFSRRMCWPCR